MINTLFWFAIGLLIIIKGGDLFVEGASAIAKKTGIPSFVIGATIVSVATTLPEMMVSFLAVKQGSLAMGLGNAVGSVTCNTGLILGLGILLAPGIVPKKEIREKGILLLVCTCVIWLFSLSGDFGGLEKVILAVAFILFLIFNFTSARQNPDSAPAFAEGKIGKFIFMLLIGAVAITLGADLLVDNGTVIAEYMNIPESVIGLTLLAVGTSLPELITMITAIRKKEMMMSIGNIMGANIINLTIIPFVCSVIFDGNRFPVDPNMIAFDLPICLFIGAVAVLPSLISEKFSRWQGFVLMSCYVLYVVRLFI